MLSWYDPKLLLQRLWRIKAADVYPAPLTLTSFFKDIQTWQWHAYCVVVWIQALPTRGLVVVKYYWYLSPICLELERVLKKLSYESAQLSAQTKLLASTNRVTRNPLLCEIMIWNISIPMLHYPWCLTFLWFILIVPTLNKSVATLLIFSMEYFRSKKMKYTYYFKSQPFFPKILL